MVSAEPRGGNNPSLNEALGWIGSGVHDIHGAGVGRLDDFWIDPTTGAPRWLLVTEGRFGSRTTLIPFEDVAGSAGHVWIPYERDVVRDAPAVAPRQPLTKQVEDSLRSHYDSPRRVSQRRAPAAAERGEPAPSRYPRPPVPRHGQSFDANTSQEQPRSPPPPAYPPAPAAPYPPASSRQQPGFQHGHQQYEAPPQGYPSQGYPSPPAPGWQSPPVPEQQGPAPGGVQPEAHAVPPAGPVGAAPPGPPGLAPDEGEDLVALPIIHKLDRPYEVEVKLSGEITFRGDLRDIRLVPRGPEPAADARPYGDPAWAEEPPTENR
jgi:hypothetical protein